MENGAARGKAGGYDWTSLTKGGSSLRYIK